MDIENLELHDAPLTGLNIDFDNASISIRYQLYSEEINDYNQYELQFIDVRRVMFDFTDTGDKLADAEIYSKDIEPICTGNTRIKLSFLFGSGQPDGSLQFEYSNVQWKQIK